MTYKLRRSVIIVVAKGALQEYFSFLKLKPWKAYSLYTFVDTNRFDPGKAPAKLPSENFRMISVGALRTQKNYSYLINAMADLKNEPIELHIYGVGNLQKDLQQQIETSGAKVVLKGEVKQIENVITQYDLYVMSSSFEGFSLSVLEAMSMGMPLLLSDIPSFREQCEQLADYFPLNNAAALSEMIKQLSGESKNELEKKGRLLRQRALDNFTLPQHIAGLRSIYAETMAGTD